MKSLNHSIIKLTLCVVTGILMGYFIELSFKGVLLIFGSLFLLFIVAFIRSLRSWLQDAFFGVASFLLFISIGMLTWHLHLPENQDRHFVNLVDMPSEQAVHAQIQKVLKSYGSYDNYVVELQKSDVVSLEGKLLLKVKRDSLSLANGLEKLNVDDVVWFKNTLEVIPKPKNPTSSTTQIIWRTKRCWGKAKSRLLKFIAFQKKPIL